MISKYLLLRLYALLSTKCFYDCVRIDSVIDNKINTPKITISSNCIPSLRNSNSSHNLKGLYFIAVGLGAGLRIRLLKSGIMIGMGGKASGLCLDIASMAGISKQGPWKR